MRVKLCLIIASCRALLLPNARDILTPIALSDAAKPLNAKGRGTASGGSRGGVSSIHQSLT